MNSLLFKQKQICPKAVRATTVPFKIQTAAGITGSVIYGSGRLIDETYKRGNEMRRLPEIYSNANIARYSPTLILFVITALMALVTAVSVNAEGEKYTIHVHTGEVNQTIEYFKSKDFWGDAQRGEDLDVPPVIIAVTTQKWDKEAQKVDVRTKKELFYRAIVPMVLYSNELIKEERQQLLTLADKQKETGGLDAQQKALLEKMVEKYKVSAAEIPKQLEELLEKVDTVPPSLALGQTAYESGYGTSRFAVEGNALFGQWTFGGKGMKPKEHRASKGDYGVAAFKWPFDSVRSYMNNLNSHTAYKELRKRRAEIRKKGREPNGTELAETLLSYSEKGEEYVKTLKSIIKVNGLAVADKAYLRKEPVTFIVGVKGEGSVEETENKIKELRESGELEKIIKSMDLGL